MLNIRGFASSPSILLLALCLGSSLAAKAPTATPPTNAPRDRNCSTYNQGDTPHANCDDMPGMTCSGGCSGGYVAQGCYLKEGDPVSQQTCTIGWGSSSATQYVCRNAQGLFTCNGTKTGTPICHKCVEYQPGDGGDTGGGGNTGSGNNNNNNGGGNTGSGSNNNNNGGGNTGSGNKTTPGGNPGTTPKDPETPSAASTVESLKAVVLIVSAAFGALVM